VPDERVYLDAVGALFDYDTTTPGPHAHTLDELTSALKDLDAVRSEYATAYDEFVHTFTPFDDGHAAERFVAAVFPASGEDDQ
jgi:CDP-glycerol glycerophosphotransferase